MGQGISITCENCHETKYFQLGIGMSYYALENVLDCLHHTKRKQVSDILAEHHAYMTEYSHELYGCPRCNRLYSRFHVEFSYDLNRKYETSYNCNRCKVPLKRIKEKNIRRIPCSSCGKKALRVDEEMCWD